MPAESAQRLEGAPTARSASRTAAGGARVLFKAASPIAAAGAITLRDNERVADMFQKAGVDLSEATGWAINRARAKPVSASFTTTTPALRATSPQFAVDGFTISGLPAQSGGYLAPNTIWGACSTALTACGNGSAEAEHWLEVDLRAPRKVDTVKLYLFNDFNDKSFNARDNGMGNTYRQPSAYSIQYHDGSAGSTCPAR